MNEMINSIVFYIASALMLVFAFLTISFKNIFYSLLSAICVFFLCGFFFYILGSEYNAVIQIAIYCVAIPVLLGLAIMFTNAKPKNKSEDIRNTKNTFFVVLASGLFVLGLIYLVMTSFAIVPDSFVWAENIVSNSMESLVAFGRGIYVKYVWAFELVSLILTIVVAGLAMLKFKNKRSLK